MGNPHADGCRFSRYKRYRNDRECHSTTSTFPDSVNVGHGNRFRNRNCLRVFERGVGETLSCGTGACAAVTYGRLLGRLDRKVTVATLGGNLQIEWKGVGSDLKMIGPAESVFDGEFRP